MTTTCERPDEAAQENVREHAAAERAWCYYLDSTYGYEAAIKFCLEELGLSVDNFDFSRWYQFASAEAFERCKNLMEPLQDRIEEYGGFGMEASDDNDAEWPNTFVIPAASVEVVYYYLRELCRREKQDDTWEP